jgi:hypothetical protein
MTIKSDEADLARHVLEGGDALAFNGMHIKRLCAVLSKWEGKGWWEYGVSVRAGWLTDQGRAALAERGRS